jgi:hypothetical protein
MHLTCICDLLTVALHYEAPLDLFVVGSSTERSLLTFGASKIGLQIECLYDCHRAKSRTILKQGLLKPLPIPRRKWLDLSMDFIQDLPPCYRNGRTYRHGMVVVDRLTKVHF